MNFVDNTVDLTAAIAGTYDWALIALSVFVAALGSFGALELADRIKDSQGVTNKFMWLTTGGVTVGSSVWGMHFIGMLAFSLPINVAYDPLITLLSMIPAIIAGGVVLYVISGKRLTKLQLIFGGVFMGAGIGTMHYSGMMAMQMDAVMLYDPILFAVSIFVAILLATMALYVKILADEQTSEIYLHWKRFGSAWLMGFAIAGMHYTAMTGVKFYQTDISSAEIMGLDSRYMAVLTGLVVVGLIGLSNIASAVGRRLDSAILLEKEVAERHKADVALKESEARFRDVAEISGDWIWEMDADLRLSSMSPRFFDIFPIERDQLIGKTRQEFAGITEKDDHWRTHFDDLANHRQFRNFEYETLQADGRPSNILISGKPVFDSHGVFQGYRGTGTDKTAEVEARRALEESEKQFRNLIEGSIQGVFVHRDWKTMFANQALADILGYESVKELLALEKTSLMLDPEEHDRLWGYNLARLKGEYAPETYEARGLKKNGSSIWLELRVKPVNWQGQSAMQCVAIDITERKKAEETLRQQNEHFNAALSNMTQGLAMFNGDQRLVVCNNRFTSMYGLRPEQVKPGTRFRQILQYRIANGVYAGNSAEEFIEKECAAVVKSRTSKKNLELVDGRTVVIAYQPLPNGGWLDTHEDITDFRLIEKRLAHMAHHDALTDLPNRMLLRDRMEQELKRTRQGNVFALLCLDLDGFKEINDTFGHATGDQLLKAVSERLRNCVKETDMIARLGGDEFAIIQTSKKQPEDAAALAERICQEISAPFKFGQNEVVLGNSIGIAVVPKDGTEYEQLLKNADMALYRTKKEHRGSYSFFHPDMEASVKDRHALALDLRKALGANQFDLHFQPLINLGDNKVSGFEALLRWRHPERGMVPLTEFIPIAEETGLINQIGEWALNQACREAMNWPDDIEVAVNVSPVQFRKGNLHELVKNTLAVTGLPPARLELEVTESVLLQNKKATLTTLRQLHDLGVQISMDDFGTGYSSLSYLQSFPFDKIKIDASFIRDLSKGEDGIGIVQAVVGLASRLGVTTVAEGVETEEQLNFIRNEGCTQAQGYYFARPLPAKDISFLFPRQLTEKCKAQLDRAITN